MNGREIMSFSMSPYEKSIRKLFENAAGRKYPKNQLIFYQGDPLSSICLIKSGYIKAYTILDSGDMRTLFLLGPGDVFPIAFSIDLNWDTYSLRYFYQALADVELLTIPKDHFKNAVESQPDITLIYLAYMAATNEAIITQLEMLKTKGAINKVAHLLPYLVKKLGAPIDSRRYKLLIKVSHQEIADLTGLTRETATQQIKKLENDGVISQKKGTWVIKLSKEQEESLRA